jgi:hypothetical protein
MKRDGGVSENAEDHNREDVSSFVLCDKRGQPLTQKIHAPELNRTGLVGGPIQREDGAHGTTQQVLPGGA